MVLLISMVSSINIAVPTLSTSSLHPSATEILWIVDAYVIVFAGLLIPAGALGDRHGRRQTLLVGMGLFGAGCLLAGVGPSVAVVLAGRAVAGCGAALAMPATLSISISVHPPREHPYAVAIWTVATGAGGITGPLYAGPVLSLLGWRALFLVIVPVVAALGLYAWRVVPSIPNRAANIDPLGSVLLASSFGSLLFGIIEGPYLGWSSAPILGALAAAVGLLAIFGFVESRVPEALLDLRAFRDPDLRAGTLGVLAIFFGMFALIFANAQYLQYGKGYSAILTGLSTLPIGAAFSIVSLRSLAIASRLNLRLVVALGFLALVGGLVLLSLCVPDTPYELYAGCLVLMAGGGGLCAPILSHAIVAALPGHRAGMGSGLNGAVRELGSALGIATLGTALNARFFAGAIGDPQAKTHSIGEVLERARDIGPDFHRAAVHDFIAALSYAFRIVAAILLVVALLVVLWLHRADWRHRPPADAAPFSVDVAEALHYGNAGREP